MGKGKRIGKNENEDAPRGLVTAGLRVAKRNPLNGSLGLMARPGLFAPNMSDRTHRHAAKGSEGLRERSAGAAAEMFLLNGHWNVDYCAQRSSHANFYFHFSG
jgi:hypothetical protein